MLKKYCLVDYDRVIEMSNTSDDIDHEKTEIVEQLIEEGETYLHLRTFEKIKREDVNEYDSILILKLDNGVASIQFDEHKIEKDIVVEKNEAIYGLIA